MPMTGIIGILVHRLAVGLRRFRVILLLRVGIPQQVVGVGRRGVPGCFLQQVNRLLGLAFVDQQLAELFQGLPVVGIMIQDSAQHLFRFVVAIFEAIQAG